MGSISHFVAGAPPSCSRIEPERVSRGFGTGTVAGVCTIYAACRRPFEHGGHYGEQQASLKSHHSPSTGFDKWCKCANPDPCRSQPLDGSFCPGSGDRFFSSSSACAARHPILGANDSSIDGSIGVALILGTRDHGCIVCSIGDIFVLGEGVAACTRSR